MGGLTALCFLGFAPSFFLPLFFFFFVETRLVEVIREVDELAAGCETSPASNPPLSSVVVELPNLEVGRAFLDVPDRLVLLRLFFGTADILRITRLDV